MSAALTRGYRGAGDLHSIQHALAHWISQGAVSHLHPGDIPHRLYNGFRGQYSLEDNVRIWGAGSDQTVRAFAIVYPDWEGYDALVEPSFFDSELEFEVERWAYRQAAEWMEKRGQTDRLPGTDVALEDTRRCRFLEQLGYQGEEQVNVVTSRSLHDPNLPAEPMLPAGFFLRPCEGEKEAAALAEVHASAFDSDWSEELYRDQVMRQPGYSAEREIVIVSPEGQLCAFTIFWLDHINRTGLFEPVGVHQDFQRRGFGRALMISTMKIMRDLHGMARAQVAHEFSNAAPAGLYASLGFIPTLNVWDYRKAA